MQTPTKAETQIRQRRFTVDEFHRMAEAGILHEDDRVELIGGEIVEMNPLGGRHAACVREINRLLSRQLEDELRVDVQSPVRLGEQGAPQPDLAVIRARGYGDSPLRERLPAPPAGRTGRDARVSRVAHAHPSGRRRARLNFSRSRAEVLLD